MVEGKLHNTFSFTDLTDTGGNGLIKQAVIISGVFLLLFSCATRPSEKPAENVIFYPPPPQKPRIQFLHSITGEEDLGESQSAFDTFLFGKPTSEKRLGKSYDIGSSKGKIYVLDRRIRKLIIIDLSKKKIDHVRDQWKGALRNPSGIWITPDDFKYVADMDRKQIVLFGTDNRFIRTYGGPDLFDKPVDVFVYQDRIYVCDMNKNGIFVFDSKSGNVVTTIGDKGTEKGFLNKPTRVVVDHQGYIFVNDSFNFRVQKFDPDGRYIQSYGFLGDSMGAFVRPKGLDIDREGHLYVADAGFENVQIFDDRTGQLLLFFGGSGSAPGSMYLPSGVHIDYANTDYFSNFADKDFKLKYVIYVGNMFGAQKLNVYGFGEWMGQ